MSETEGLIGRPSSTRPPANRGRGCMPSRSQTAVHLGSRAFLTDKAPLYAHTHTQKQRDRTAREKKKKVHTLCHRLRDSHSLFLPFSLALCRPHILWLRKNWLEAVGFGVFFTFCRAGIDDNHFLGVLCYGHSEAESCPFRMRQLCRSRGAVVCLFACWFFLGGFREK